MAACIRISCTRLQSSCNFQGRTTGISKGDQGYFTLKDAVNAVKSQKALSHSAYLFPRFSNRTSRYYCPGNHQSNHENSDGNTFHYWATFWPHSKYVPELSPPVTFCVLQNLIQWKLVTDSRIDARAIWLILLLWNTSYTTLICCGWSTSSFAKQGKAISGRSIVNGIWNVQLVLTAAILK